MSRSIGDGPGADTEVTALTTENEWSAHLLTDQRENPSLGLTLNTFTEVFAWR